MKIELTRLQTMYLKSLLEIEIDRQANNADKIMQIAVSEFKNMLSNVESALESTNDQT